MIGTGSNKAGPRVVMPEGCAQYCAKVSGKHARLFESAHVRFSKADEVEMPSKND